MTHATSCPAPESDPQDRIQVLRQELDGLVEAARQAPPGPGARDTLRAVLARMQELAREVAALQDDPLPPEVRVRMAGIQQLLDNWDELGPIWEAFRALEGVLSAEPRTRETARKILERAQELRSTLDRMRDLVPASYYEEVAGGFDPMIAALSEALSQPAAEEE